MIIARAQRAMSGSTNARTLAVARAQAVNALRNQIVMLMRVGSSAHRSLDGEHQRRTGQRDRDGRRPLGETEAEFLEVGACSAQARAFARCGSASRLGTGNTLVRKPPGIDPQ